MVGRTFLGRFETVRLLGEGGMGRVYLGQDVTLRRKVVIKVMHDHVANDPNFRKRFEREIDLMVRFQHPYVVTLYDASLDDPEGPCIVMEYIKGVTLDTVLHRNNRLSASRIARLLSQLCEALFAAHQEGIIHRDLKPANLMVVDSDTPYEKIKVMDFGLAKLIDNKLARGIEKPTVTNADFAVGTPGYISPEQVRGDEMDHRSDLYSVGVILFELLTGRLPFSGGETMDVLLAHATQPPPSFTEIGACSWVSPAVEAVVHRCLAKHPADRPSTARELAEMYDAAVVGEMPAKEVLTREHKADTQSQRDGDVPPPAQTVQLPAPDFDPLSINYELHAWMPDAVATYKLRGFVEDVGGAVLESVPGKIRVRLGDKGSVYFVPSPLSWLGLGSKAHVIDMVLLLQPSETQASLLKIAVNMRSAHSRASLSESFRERCGQVYCDLRAYLMGDGVAAS